MENKEVYVCLPGFNKARDKACEKADKECSGDITRDGKTLIVMSPNTAYIEGFLSCYQWLEAQTLPLQECYVEVYKDEWFAMNQEARHQLLAGRDLKTGEPVWLKKVTLPLKEQEGIIKSASENNSASVVSLTCTSGNSIEQVISDKYDVFFGKGFWEDQYKKHIVIFAKQCFHLLIKKP
jgi:hypothetical protein